MHLGLCDIYISVPSRYTAELHCRILPPSGPFVVSVPACYVTCSPGEQCLFSSTYGYLTQGTMQTVSVAHKVQTRETDIVPVEK